MKATESVSVMIQGPSKVLHTVYDNKNYQSHRQRLASIEQDVSRTMDTFEQGLCPLGKAAGLGPAFVTREKGLEIERNN